MFQQFAPHVHNAGGKAGRQAHLSWLAIVKQLSPARKLIAGIQQCGLALSNIHALKLSRRQLSPLRLLVLTEVASDLHIAVGCPRRAFLDAFAATLAEVGIYAVSPHNANDRLLRARQFARRAAYAHFRISYMLEHLRGLREVANPATGSHP